MNEQTLIQIADDLAARYETRAKTSLIQWQAKQDIERIKTSLIPPDGWPGKNEEQRRTAAEKVYAEDDALQAAIIKGDTAYRAIVALDAEIAGLEAKRKALEWTIRAQLVDALRRDGITVKPLEDPFQAVMDQTIDDDLLPF